MNFEPYTAAAVQASPVYLDKEETLKKTENLIEEASNQGADLIVFPEAFISGYPYFAWLGTPMWYHEFYKEWYKSSIEVPGPEIDRLGRAAREAGAFLIAGVNEIDGETIYNTQVFIDEKGELVGKRRKLMPTHVERTVWGMGDGSDIFTIDTDSLGTIGGLICWEHTMDLIRHSLYTMGEDVHAAIWVGFSNVTGWEDLFNQSTELCSRYHAHVGETFVINAQNTCDQELVDKLQDTEYQEDWITTGGGWTAIIAPGGGILAGPLEDEEGILTAEINPEAKLDMAHYHDADGHYARPDIAQLYLDRSSRSVANDMQQRPVPTGTTKLEGALDSRLRNIEHQFEQIKQVTANLESPELEDAIEGMDKELTKLTQ